MRLLETRKVKHSDEAVRVEMFRSRLLGLAIKNFLVIPES